MSLNRQLFAIRLFGTIGILSSCLMLAGCNMPLMVAKETRNTTATVSTTTSIEIEAKNGPITVVCQPELNEAKIEAKISCRGLTQKEADERLARTELVVDNTKEKVLKIFAKFPEPSTNGESVAITLHVPSVDSARLTTSNGSIDVDGSLSLISGLVEAHTSNASVSVKSAQTVKAESSNGSVSLEKIGGDVIAQTSNASVTASDIGGKVNISSSNGTLAIRLNEGQLGPISARTSNASIKLSLASDFAGKLSVNTSNASIEVQDPTNRITESNLKKTSGTMTVGSESIGSEIAPSQLSTSNGSISVSILPSL